MEEKHIEELNKAFELANIHGQWMPMAILGSFFGIIILLLLYIYKKDLNLSNKRHTDNEELIKKLSEGQIKLEKILVRLDTTLNLKS